MLKSVIIDLNSHQAWLQQAALKVFFRLNHANWGKHGFLFAPSPNKEIQFKTTKILRFSSFTQFVSRQRESTVNTFLVDFLDPQKYLGG